MSASRKHAPLLLKHFYTIVPHRSLLECLSIEHGTCGRHYVLIWISVIVKCGSTIVVPQTMQCSFEGTFGDVVQKLQPRSKVEKVSIQATRCL